jgi:transposase
MYFTGIDLHRKTCYVAVINDEGKTVQKANLVCQETEVLAFLKRVAGPMQIVIESSSSWYWLYDVLAQHGYEVMISHPAKTKAIASAKTKNDKIDAHMLAQLLRADLIPAVHVSSLETRRLKELLRHRSRLVRDVTRMKNRIHTILAKNNRAVPCSDLFGIQGLHYLQEVSLPDYQRQQVETYLRLYEALLQQIEPLTKRIQSLAKQNPMARLLMTIPGIGPTIALFIVAEIEDIKRFDSYRKLASYAGLVPSLDASADKQRRGSITRQGSPWLRTALIEAAHVVPRMRNRRLHLYFRRRIVRGGYRKAIVATAHKLLQIVFYVLKNQTPYQEQIELRA